MISGAHFILYSADADADRRFFRDVLKLPSVDAGGGWLIFALPAAELAVHPSEDAGTHELFLVCDDLDATIRVLKRRKIRCSAPSRQSWGRIIHITLPSGVEIGLYQPSHARPPS